jgi:hypothetical protein
MGLGRRIEDTQLQLRAATRFLDRHTGVNVFVREKRQMLRQLFAHAFLVSMTEH